MKTIFFLGLVMCVAMVTCLPAPADEPGHEGHHHHHNKGHDSSEEEHTHDEHEGHHHHHNKGHDSSEEEHTHDDEHKGHHHHHNKGHDSSEEEHTHDKHEGHHHHHNKGHDSSEESLQKAGVRIMKNKGACMKRLMDVNEAREVCQDRTKWAIDSLCLTQWELIAFTHMKPKRNKEHT